MALQAFNQGYCFIGTGTTGGTAPGTASAPTGCTINGTTADISNWVQEVDTGADVASQDVTVLGSGGYAAFVAGIASGVCDLVVLQDYAASSINVFVGLNGTIAKPVPANGTTNVFFVEVRQSSGARSATNPGFICKVVHLGMRPFQVKVGEPPKFALKLQPTGSFGELIA